MYDVFSPDSTIAQLADWVELDHFLSRRRRSTDSRLIRADEIVDDELSNGTEPDPESGEPVEVEIAELRLEQRRDDVLTELLYRYRTLGDVYPFDIAPNRQGGYRLSTAASVRSSATRSARYAYLATMLMSSFRHRLLNKDRVDEDSFKKLVREIPQLFQGLSLCAAASLFGPDTRASWFGFPRPDHSSFLTALTSLVADIGHGELKLVPPYNTQYDKDATIDIVAWRGFGDGTYGSLLLFGQVASGNNWVDKPVQTHIKARFFDHFIDEPASQYFGATFIPFVMHTNVITPSDGNYAGAVRDHSRQMELTHGLLVDRLRLVELISRSADRCLPDRVDPREWSPMAVARWIASVRQLSDRPLTTPATA